MAAPATTGADTRDDVILRAVDISKWYGATHALKGVNFEVRRGKVTVLFGENGAGKSTLMKILAGVEQPSGGHLELDGKRVELRSPTEAVDHGISIIHQELNLCPNLSVRDNIFMGRERTRLGGVDYRSEREVVRRLMERLEEDIDPDTLVSDLRLGQQQIVEIARALSLDTRILIMDEPTSALSAAEVEVLFRVIKELTANGVAIVYISHHLEEAIEISDHAVVFRDGELVATADAADIDLPWVVGKMVGRSAGYDFRDEERDHGDVALSIENVKIPDPTGNGRLAVNDVSLTVRRGEIVCLYGLMGAGRTELVEALAGRGEIASGRVLLDGEDITGLPIPELIRRGIGLVPEDRQRDGLVQSMSVGQNLSLSSLWEMVRRFLLSRRGETERVGKGIENVRVKTAGAGAPITSLSGGNQQKVVIGKILMTGPKVLLLDEPTRGIDVGAKGEIFSLLFREARKGLAVLYVTSEIGEAITASHRIVVMAKGRVVGEFDPRTASREEIMAASGESEVGLHPIGTPSE
ncbi:sugar ABC transporter ATP-binding protein [Thermostaphylospora chromogena]|uniref:Monosaccharide ABC transporter ATP-binding protein, CUT2 family n=1 Tax=Thermostaphylospora chromogena TaxID=35622 RepID=A0A1H1GT01_9ACTN|nr:sugar ABC transporter ATP-binding protein [Thermostaphylospora chromogena]SDR15976.1 monosaccharide ABC transporter ATP-binding protein, CUT2 family [Thermostaphylospora chromogena]